MAVVVAALGLAAACSSAGSRTKPLVTQPPAATSTSLKLDTSAKELLGLLTKGKQVVYHATYTAVVQGTSASLELWQKPPLVRRDTNFNVGGSSSTKTEEFKLHDQLVGCLQQSGGPWKCTQEPASSGDPSDAVLSNVGASLSGRSVTARSDTVSGRPVRCYSAAAVGSLGAVEICLTPDTGIPVLVDAGAGRITLASFELTVPDNVFSLPATPTPVTTTTITP